MCKSLVRERSRTTQITFWDSVHTGCFEGALYTICAIDGEGRGGGGLLLALVSKTTRPKKGRRGSMCKITEKLSTNSQSSKILPRVHLIPLHVKI